MRFQTELVPATLIRRYKRFLADIRLEDGREVTAHCPNPGAMTGMAEEGTRIWVEPNDDPKKKLNFGWRLAAVGGAMVVVDTSLANRIVGEALAAGLLPEFTGNLRAEVAYGENSRADFLLTNGNARRWIEVKSVTLSRQAGLAEFPDTKTARGAKHLATLAAQVEAGDNATMLYLVARTDCDHVAVAADIDPTYAAAEVAARAAGVSIRAYGIKATPEEITLVPTPLHVG
ncbi:DNA/RNA nuclease SfsA [Celeribacter sp.]|uniref:DNA/RNA nuclease SfsA n=1 Tax=Celeribacter sp. TaxID=1890673 RepID=UPI003A8E256B